MNATEISNTRRRLGLTQNEFAPFLGITPKALSDLERARYSPSATIVRLLRAYGDGYRPADWPATAPATPRPEARFV